MAKTRKEHLLSALDGLEGELASRKGHNSLSSLHEHEKDEEDGRESENLAGERAHDKGGEHEGEARGGATEEGKPEKEVERHLVESGQFDCPHCGHAVRVK